ncbi:exodeoxyribonuclease VII large subunit [Deinococcus lacus]|uniref:Exodeoxyribonuclease VII large subunit n=1 Tax=Deinococcus lacus TaxID=392561 RepID=A0ABW1YCE5_9DEIO
MTRPRTPRKPAAARPPEQFLELADVLDYVAQVLARGLPGAVWVRAEIASVTDRRHLYLELIQHESGAETAKCRATLWASERYALEARFRAVTGGGLAAGMTVLIFATAEFHPQYGFSLHIVDLAPEYTVGEAAAQLEARRAELVAAGIYSQNRSLPPPSDYARIAVIAPKEAAGLGDFRRELDPLVAAGVLDMQLLPATFQGALLLPACRGRQRRRTPYTSRPRWTPWWLSGGGSVTDLAWLNDTEFARALATFPVPVLTGLGHARDTTLPDEVACLRTDTPSKAAALIVRQIVQAAAQAEQDYQTVAAAARAEWVDAQAGLLWLWDRAQSAASRQVEEAQQQVTALMRQAVGLSPRHTLERGYVLARRVEGGAPVIRAAELRPGETLDLEFQDGTLRVEVKGEPA